MLEKDKTDKAWTELVASEIYSAKVDVVPRAQEYNIHNTNVHVVSSDPHKGR